MTHEERNGIACTLLVVYESHTENSIKLLYEAAAEAGRLDRYWKTSSAQLPDDGLSGERGP